MTDRRVFIISLSLLFLLLAGPSGASAATPSAQKNWPQWRGPLLTGEAPTADPPVTWSETNNMRWKTKLPGAGTATPIVWEDQGFILTAIPTGKKTETKPGASGEVYRFDVLSYSRKDGKLQWQKTAREEAPHEGHHQNHGFASASPVTDGEYLLAYFGSRGLHCYDL